MVLFLSHKNKMCVRKLGLLARAFELFHRMRLSELRPDSVSILSLTQLSAVVKNLNVTKAVHCLQIRVGVEVYVSVPNT
ncbi:hypothetical protein AAC387_Pa10g1319 [Persea americana]